MTIVANGARFWTRPLPRDYLDMEEMTVRWAEGKSSTRQKPLDHERSERRRESL